MIRAVSFALAAALFAGGCASPPDAGPGAEGCKLASAAGTNAVPYGRQPPQSEMDRRFARVDLARLDYRREHMNDQPSATEESIRNCP